jgi:hypothetical protein
LRKAPWGLWLSGLVYLALILPTLRRQGIDWDEQTDLLIAESYLRPGGLWIGSPLDPINVRLPMYLGGLLFRLTGPDLITARLLSCAAGVATLWAVWIWCRRDFGRRCGTLACLVVATSPYFLSYSRLAFTDGDVFIACAVAWLLVAASRFAERPSLGRAAAIGFALGLALSSKISALSLAPALSIWLVLRGRGDGGTPQPVRELLASLGTIAVVSVVTFLLVPPVHATNPTILASLLEGFLEGGRGIDPRMAAEAAALHVLVLLLKPSVGIGVALLVFGVIAAWQARVRAELRLPGLIVAAYGAFLLTLPWAQTRYMIPVFVVLVVPAADGVLRLFARWRLPVAAAGVAAVALLISDHVRVYPDFNLNGYQWVGERVIAGRSSLGGRSIAEVGSDGVEQTLRWIRSRAGPGDRVVSFIRPQLIVTAVLPKPQFVMLDGLRDATLLKSADYAITTINTQIDAGFGPGSPAGPIRRYPYNRKLLVSQFTRVFSVERAFGIEVAAVWRRNERRALPTLD